MRPLDPSSAPDGAPSQRAPTRPGRRVLLAEDDAAMRDLLAQQLQRAGYYVILAEDGLHLLTRLDASTSAAARLPFDAIVSDVRMPGADGMRILQWLRAQGSRIPVVLISAFGTGELHAEAKGLGAVLVDKPFEMAQLAAALQDAIGPGDGRVRRGGDPDAPAARRPAPAPARTDDGTAAAGGAAFSRESSAQDTTGRGESGASQPQDRAAGPNAQSNTDQIRGRARGGRGRGGVCRAHADIQAGV